MRIYQNCKEMMSEVHRDLQEMGVIKHTKTVQDKIVDGNDDYTTKELVGYSYAILDFSDMDQMITDNGLSLEWCKADFEERICPREINPGEAYKLRPVWEEFVHDGKFSYTYNERIRTQLEKTIDVIKNDHDTRQGIIEIYNSEKDSRRRGGIERIPCSMYYQFISDQNGKLDIIYNIRSNDFGEHYPYDIWMAISLLKYVAKKVDMKVGKLIYFAGSLHCFKKDLPTTF